MGLCQERMSPQHILWRARFRRVKVLRAPLHCAKERHIKTLVELDF